MSAAGVCVICGVLQPEGRSKAEGCAGCGQPAAAIVKASRHNLSALATHNLPRFGKTATA